MQSLFTEMTEPQSEIFTNKDLIKAFSQEYLNIS